MTYPLCLGKFKLAEILFMNIIFLQVWIQCPSACVTSSKIIKTILDMTQISLPRPSGYQIVTCKPFSIVLVPHFVKRQKQLRALDFEILAFLQMEVSYISEPVHLQGHCSRKTLRLEYSSHLLVYCLYSSAVISRVNIFYHQAWNMLVEAAVKQSA